MDIKLVIAAHKPFIAPADKIYLPLQVGAAKMESMGFANLPDSTGHGKT